MFWLAKCVRACIHLHFHSLKIKGLKISITKILFSTCTNHYQCLDPLSKMKFKKWNAEVPQLTAKLPHLTAELLQFESRQQRNYRSWYLQLRKFRNWRRRCWGSCMVPRPVHIVARAVGNGRYNGGTSTVAGTNCGSSAVGVIKTAEVPQLNTEVPQLTAEVPRFIFDHRAQRDHFAAISYMCEARWGPS